MYLQILFFKTISVAYQTFKSIYDLDVKRPPQVLAFEHLVPSLWWWDIVEHLGDGAKLDKVGGWGPTSMFIAQPHFLSQPCLLVQRSME